MTDVVVQFRELSETEALSRVRGRRVTDLSPTALAAEWKWPRSRVRRRLQQWASEGHLVAGRRGRKVPATMSAVPAIEPAKATLFGRPATLEAQGRPLMHDAPSIAPEDAGLVTEPVRGPAGHSGGRLADWVAYLTAVAMAGVAAYFSVGGMVEIFPGMPAAVVALAGTMELAKLVICGWLASNWRATGWLLRTELVTLVAGLALLNGVGVFGRLVEAHVGVTVAAAASVGERIGALDARVGEQVRAVENIDTQLGQIDGAIAKLTEKGRASNALEAMAHERKTRDGLVAARQQASATLVDLRSQRAGLYAERQRVEASTGPVRYIAVLTGMDTESAVRWLILLIVLCCDPAAIALTVAASRPRL